MPGLLLLALSFASPPAPPPGWIARSIVVAAAPGAMERRPEALAQRLAALRLTRTCGFDDGLGPGLRSARVDRARVALYEAPDPTAAAGALAALAADPGVAWAEPLVPRAVCGLTVLPDDPLLRQGRQWGLTRIAPDTGTACIGAPGAWTRSVGGNGVLLAIGDTGIDPSHPDLAGPMPDGTPRLAWPLDVTGREPAGAWADSFGHGTPVAGVMAARTNDGAHFDSLGMAGVCGGDGAGNAGCRIVPIKVTPDHSGYADSWSVARAITHAADAGARAINLSLAGGAPSRLERLALADALTRGCVAVCAAGNRGTVSPREPQYPGAYAAEGLCLQVGASDEDDRRAVWSSYGPGLDLVAPGVDVMSTFMTYPSARGASYPGYVMVAGTSFATPFVTGTVGLMAAVRPDLCADDFQPVLQRTAHDVGAVGWDAETGWGRLDAAAALAWVDGGLALWHGEVFALHGDTLAADTLVVTEDHVKRPARRVRLSATVAVPDSIDSPVAWVRASRTTTAPERWVHPWRSAWAEAAVSGRWIALHGDLYAPVDSGAWWPVPPESARIAFTVAGRLRRPRPRPLPPVALARPNPFRGATQIVAPAGTPLDVLDVTGRRRAHLVTHADGIATWNGHDERGRSLPPGLYLVRANTGLLRIVKLQ